MATITRILALIPPSIKCCLANNQVQLAQVIRSLEVRRSQWALIHPTLSHKPLRAPSLQG